MPCKTFGSHPPYKAIAAARSTKSYQLMFKCFAFMIKWTIVKILPRLPKDEILSLVSLPDLKMLSQGRMQDRWCAKHKDDNYNPVATSYRCLFMSLYTVETCLTTNSVWQPTLNYGDFVSVQKESDSLSGDHPVALCDHLLPSPKAGHISGFRLYICACIYLHM